MSNPIEKLDWQVSGEANEYTLMSGGNWLAMLRLNGEMLVDKQRGIVRRIVACFNACAGFSTEVLEDAISEGRGVIRALQLQRDVAWEEAREIREAIKANPEESTADEVRRVVAQRDDLLAYAKNLRDVKGRHHSEQAFKALVEAVAKVEAANA